MALKFKELSQSAPTMPSWAKSDQAPIDSNWPVHQTRSNWDRQRNSTSVQVGCLPSPRCQTMAAPSVSIGHSHETKHSGRLSPYDDTLDATSSTVLSCTSISITRLEMDNRWLGCSQRTEKRQQRYSSGRNGSAFFFGWIDSLALFSRTWLALHDGRLYLLSPSSASKLKVLPSSSSSSLNSTLPTSPKYQIDTTKTMRMRTDGGGKLVHPSLQFHRPVVAYGPVTGHGVNRRKQRWQQSRDWFWWAD